MTSYAANPSDKNWNESMAALRTLFSRWGVSAWAVSCPMQPTSSAKPSRSPWVWAREFGQPHESQVTVTFTHPSGAERTVTVSRFGYPQDNLWAIAIGLDAIRLNEKRGLDDVYREFYGALPPPSTERPKRDPWEVLGLLPTNDPDMIAAAYRARAKRLHPDHGGDPEAFKELHSAYEAVKGKA